MIYLLDDDQILAFIVMSYDYSYTSFWKRGLERWKLL